MSAFARTAVADLIAKCEGLGVPVPDEVRQIVTCGSSNGGALLYARAHPDDDDPTVPDELHWCCYGSASGRLDACTCWEPTWNVEQAEPRPLASAADLAAQPRMCGDCAFRKGSPERATEYEQETLLGLADRGVPFWCHDGMRRPLSWRHPHGITIEGDPADWQPPILSAVPYRADGSPGLLCAGWAARAVRAKERQ